MLGESSDRWTINGMEERWGDEQEEEVVGYMSKARALGVRRGRPILISRTGWKPLKNRGQERLDAHYLRKRTS